MIDRLLNTKDAAAGGGGVVSAARTASAGMALQAVGGVAFPEAHEGGDPGSDFLLGIRCGDV